MEFFFPVSLWTLYLAVSNLTLFSPAALRRYNEVNGDLPDRIMIFRDGVGDGQLKTVVEHEVPQLKASFNEVSGGYK